MTNAPAPEPLLRVRDLRIQARTARGAEPILKGVSFDLHPGEVLGLIGESGAGKSTLGLAALGHLRDGCRRVGGEVLFRGRDILTLSPAETAALRGRLITYVAQSAAASFNPAYTLENQIGETLRRDRTTTPGRIATKIRDLFRRLGLPQPDIFGQRYPHQVSGGQLQRAMTAMALAPEPDIIVFDEPTTALDVTTQLEVLAAIKRAIREEGSAALYISHDLAVVSQISDRIMVLRHGEMMEEGTTRALIDSPRHDYTRRLLSVRHAPAPAAVTETRDTVLSVGGLHASYGLLPVLNDVTLSVKRGTTLAVVGESGSGKSTLAKVVTGLHPADRGTLRFGDDVLPLALKARDRDTLRRMQMVFQIPDTALNPRQTVGDIIGRPLRFYFGLGRRETEQRVAALLNDIELGPEFAHRYPGELSGGQKQRVCIARALAAEPDLIICDEVTSALDPLVADGIITLLRRLQRDRGVSYIFITHDLGTVKAIAHDIAVMQRGRVVDYGPRETVLSAPFHPYTELLFNSLPTTEEGWLEAALAKRPSVAATAPSDPHAAIQSDAIKPDILRSGDRPVASGLRG